MQTNSIAFDKTQELTKDFLQNENKTEKYKQEYLKNIAQIKHGDYKNILNPCGEVRIDQNGAYCLIGEVIFYFANDKQEALQGCIEVTKFLMRTLLMAAIYSEEVARTSRIGVSITGIHEWLYQFYKLTWIDVILNTEPDKIKQASDDLIEYANKIDETAYYYAKELGINPPLSTRTIKPSGSVSKLFMLTEGCHIPNYLYGLRWVQFHTNSRKEEIEKHIELGYPYRTNLQTYKDVTIIGFPVVSELGRIVPSDKITLASNAPLDYHFKWIKWLEKTWLNGPLGMQASYTAKYSHEHMSKEVYKKTIKDNMSKIKTISVLPNDATYEYLPEEPITYEAYMDLITHINNKSGLSIDKIPSNIEDDNMVDECEGGACDWSKYGVGEVGVE